MHRLNPEQAVAVVQATTSNINLTLGRGLILPSLVCSLQAALRVTLNLRIKLDGLCESLTHRGSYQGSGNVFLKFYFFKRFFLRKKICVCVWA